jgi:beta-glucosidase
VRSGKLTEARVNESVTRILSQKFHLGLFDNPFVDPAAATTLVESPATRAEADAAQRRALVLLENNRGVLPLKAGARVFVHGMSADAVRAKGFVPVATVAEAEVAIVRTSTPFETLHPITSSAGDSTRRPRLQGQPPRLRADQGGRRGADGRVNLPRPARGPGNVRDKAAAIVELRRADRPADVLAEGGAEGKLPFALPASMATSWQSPGKPHDLTPLYPLVPAARVTSLRLVPAPRVGPAPTVPIRNLPTRHPLPSATPAPPLPPSSVTSRRRHDSAG